MHNKLSARIIETAGGVRYRGIKHDVDISLGSIWIGTKKEIIGREVSVIGYESTTKRIVIRDSRGKTTRTEIGTFLSGYTPEKQQLSLPTPSPKEEPSDAPVRALLERLVVAVESVVDLLRVEQARQRRQRDRDTQVAQVVTNVANALNGQKLPNLEE
jgi:hypothetical protein